MHHQQFPLTAPNLFSLDHLVRDAYVNESRPQLIQKVKAMVSDRNLDGESTDTERYRSELGNVLDPEDVRCLITYL